MSHYHAHCCSVPHGHWSHYHGYHHGCAEAYLYYVPVVYPVMPSAPPCHTHQVLVQELEADASTPGEAIIGGIGDAHISLETYVEAGAAAPEVKVAVVQGGTSTSTTSSGLPVGYRMDEGFLTLAPGAKVTLEVVDATARLRWCETVRC